jgi:hypothetical protein
MMSPGLMPTLATGLRLAIRSKTFTAIRLGVPFPVSRRTYSSAPASSFSPPAWESTCKSVRGPSISYTPGFPTAPTTETRLLPYSLMKTEI